MRKKVSLGVLIALIALTAAIAVSLTYMIALHKFNEVLPGFNERQKMYDKVSEIDQTVRQDFLGEIDEARLKTGLSAGYIAGLGDTQAQYLTPEKYKEYLAGVSEKFVGVGVKTAEDEDGNMEVILVLPGTPAEANGIQKGDVILAIDGKEVRRIGYSDALNRLEGSVGSSVELRLLRSVPLPAQDGEETEAPEKAEKPEKEKKEAKKDAAGEADKGKEAEAEKEQNTEMENPQEKAEAEEPAKLFTRTLVREEYRENTVTSRVINGEVGCISISEFDSRTREQLYSELSSLQKAAIGSLIFDLRGNVGGSVEEAAKILDELLPEGDLIRLKDKKGTVTVEFSSASGEINLPMTVLVDGQTCGAAELFALAVRDLKKTDIVGEVTAGSANKTKLSVLSDGSAILYSVASYIDSEGKELTGVGITPDIEIPLNDTQRARFKRRLLTDAEDPQLQAALRVLKKAGAEE